MGQMTRFKPHLNAAQIRSHCVFAIYTHATSVFMCMRHTVPDVCRKIHLVDSVITSYLDSTEHLRHSVLAKIIDDIACMLHRQCNPRMHCNKCQGDGNVNCSSNRECMHCMYYMYPALNALMLLHKSA